MRDPEPTAAKSTGEVKLTGSVQRITFRNPQNGYTIARLDTGGAAPVTVVGALPAVREGDGIEVTGEWTEHPRWGRQLKVSGHRAVLPVSLEGIRRYLASGVLPGIGPRLAERIVEEFGEATFEVMDASPERLRDVPGLGRKKREAIADAWETHRAERDLLVFLHSMAIGPGLSARILARYGPASPRVVRDQPYRLAAEVHGIGFLTADAIARRTGIDLEAPERIAAGLQHVLARATEEGHVFLSSDELLERAVQLLRTDSCDVSAEAITDAVHTAAEDGELVREDDRVYLPVYHLAECDTAAAVVRLLGASPGAGMLDIEALLDQVRSEVGIAFEATQRDAIARSLTSRLLVVTGGPGTGKTTVLLGILALAERLGREVSLAAPTGRAAKRMAEVTGRTASTLHRLLEYSPREGLFRRDADRPLAGDVVVVDEASMMDLTLASRLFAALPPRAALILVGDVDQLPPVGVGNVLADIIATREADVVRLIQVFRQAEESSIIVNAHRINHGELPILKDREGRERDFFLLEEETPERVTDLIVDLAAERLPRRYGFDPLLDVQVLTPMYRGVTGAHHLNRALQERLNPRPPVLAANAPLLTPDGSARPPEGPARFRPGDKVMQLRNNYDREVFNGDMGIVADVDIENGVVRVRFEALVEYPFADLDELVLAYAISVHKSQGSEYRAVVMPLTTQHYIMLQRNLLYTAVTRARDLVVLVGSSRALRIAVRNDHRDRRNSWLAERVRQFPR